MKALFPLLLTLAAAAATVNADARRGELFGYRLGDRYPLTSYYAHRHERGLSLRRTRARHQAAHNFRGHYSDNSSVTADRGYYRDPLVSRSGAGQALL